MKGYKKLALLLFSITLLTACGNSVEKKTKVQETKVINPTQQDPPKGITVNKINYEVVGLQELDPKIKSFFNEKKNNRGYISHKFEDGYWYIGIFSGKKNTGGYGINVIHVEDVEGKTVIVVQETSPKPSSYVTQVITYPYTVIRFKNLVGSVIVRNTAGEEFKDISELGIER